ncbi:MAG: hypothetical protein OXG56_11170 [Gammaproteobacteria bacterium]|nr:hypothetical protein [Gammaproteobacteria bacterium]
MRILQSCLLFVLLTGFLPERGEAQGIAPEPPLPPGDVVQKDLGRQRAVLVQIEELLRLMGVVSQYPPSVVAVLMDTRLDNPDRLRRALRLLHGTQAAAESVAVNLPSAPEPSESPGPVTGEEVESEAVPEPVQLASKHLVFVSLPDDRNPGVVSLLIRGKAVSLTVGQEMEIDRKPYTLQHIYRDDLGNIVVVFEQGNQSIPLTWRTG